MSFAAVRVNPPLSIPAPCGAPYFRTRLGRPTLGRAGLLGTVTKINSNTGSGDEYRATWTADDGNIAIEIFYTYAQAVKHHAGEELRFHDLRHSYATWLVDDGVPVNMVQRVMGRERSATTLNLYTRRSDGENRILERSAQTGTTMRNPGDPASDLLPPVDWMMSYER